MRTFVRLVFVSILLAFATSAWSASVSHVLTCELDDDANEETIVQIVTKWLDAARTVKGGEHLQVDLHFPVAAQMNEADFKVVIKAPSASEWGAFMDHYKGSAPQKLDSEWDEQASCPDSALMRTVSIK